MNGEEEKNVPVVVEATGIDLVKSPEEVIANAARAATVLKKMINEQKLSVRIGPKEHIYFEAWQTAGVLYGVTVRSFDAESVEIGGVPGAKARAEVYRQGAVIGGAEAYCLEDEKNWKDKPFFQLASMAQTRASSKALKNVLSWIIVLAGYSPTPAEEMNGVRNGVNPPGQKPGEEAKCEVCLKALAPAIALYSAKNFGRHLCRDHQSSAASK